MNVHYDAKEDAVYIELSKGKYRRTRKVTDAILVDEDGKGKVLGIEILDAQKNIAAFDPQSVNRHPQAAWSPMVQQGALDGNPEFLHWIDSSLS